jgi:hypothetical protein
MTIREIAVSLMFWRRDEDEEETTGMHRVAQALEKLNGQRLALHLETLETDQLVRQIEVDARNGVLK